MVSVSFMQRGHVGSRSYGVKSHAVTGDQSSGLKSRSGNYSHTPIVQRSSAYYRGITSSRVIASLCKTDLKFMALAGGETPHFTTIASFVSSYPEAIADVFHKVLLVCDESGLIGKEHFAIDGCKLPSDASRQWSGTHEEL